MVSDAQEQRTRRLAEDKIRDDVAKLPAHIADCFEKWVATLPCTDDNVVGASRCAAGALNSRGGSCTGRRATGGDRPAHGRGAARSRQSVRCRPRCPFGGRGGWRIGRRLVVGRLLQEVKLASKRALPRRDRRVSADRGRVGIGGCRRGGRSGPAVLRSRSLIATRWYGGACRRRSCAAASTTLGKEAIAGILRRGDLWGLPHAKQGIARRRFARHHSRCRPRKQSLPLRILTSGAARTAQKHAICSTLSALCSPSRRKASAPETFGDHVEESVRWGVHNISDNSQ